jgi:hypothetical protein
VSDYVRTIAKARSASICREDHGILTVFIDFDYGGAGQGIPGFALDGWDEERKRRVGDSRSIEFIAALMEAFGVETFEDIPGRTVYVLHNKGESGLGGGYIVGIEPLPTERGERVIFADVWARDEVAA